MPVKYHLWTFNHNIGVADQIYFMTRLFKHLELQLTVGNKPDPGAINILIENFAEADCSTIKKFCEGFSTRVIIVMTEHLDFIKRSGTKLPEIFFHGLELGKPELGSYIESEVKLSRYAGLLTILQYSDVVCTLGTLPELRGFQEIFEKNVLRIPHCRIEPVEFCKFEPSYDFVFTGGLTPYREKTIHDIKELGFSINFPFDYLHPLERDEFVKTGKLVINIPQSSNWKWPSPMRIENALKNGRAILDFSNAQFEYMASTTKVDLTMDLNEFLIKKLSSWREMYAEQINQFNKVADSKAIDLEKLAGELTSYFYQ